MLPLRIAAVFLASAALLAACVPVPRVLYVPQSPDGELQYSTCAFNKHVPVALRLRTAEVQVTVALGTNDRGEFVEVHFEVPAGKTIVLLEDFVELTAGTPAQSARSRFPTVSLVDTPIVNSFSSLAAMKVHQVPISTPLVGQDLIVGHLPFGKNFWLATYVAPSSASEFLLKLPKFAVNGAVASLQPIKYRQQSFVGFALINC